MSSSEKQSKRAKTANTQRAKRHEDDPDLVNRTVTDGALALEPHEVELSAIEIRAVQLRMAGMTFSEIADALNYANKGGAYKAVKRALEKWGWNTVDEYRKLELNRLDTLTQRFWPAALGRPERRDDNGNVIQQGVPPDPKAADMVLRLMERRTRLLGLDAPQALDIGIIHEESEAKQTVDAYEEWLDVVGEVIDVDIIEDEEDIEVEDTGEV